MRLAEWVDEVKATGGVPDGSCDTLAALRSAATLCWADIDERGFPRSEIVQLGVKWSAAFMVSCARQGTTEFRSILTVGADRQALFRDEAARNEGVIAQILAEAATAETCMFEYATYAAGAHWIHAPVGGGKPLGG